MSQVAVFLAQGSPRFAFSTMPTRTEEGASTQPEIERRGPLRKSVKNLVAISFGIKSPLDYSVFSASAGALVLAAHEFRKQAALVKAT